MTAPQRAQFSNRANVVDEIFTEAKIDALNTKLIERGISADQVIAILPVEAQTMVNPTPPQFRVLYRTAVAIGVAVVLRVGPFAWAADWIQSVV
jgi:hypothetical protein